MFKQVPIFNGAFDVAPSPGTGEGWGGGRSCDKPSLARNQTYHAPATLSISSRKFF